MWSQHLRRRRHSSPCSAPPGRLAREPELPHPKTRHHHRRPVSARSVDVGGPHQVAVLFVRDEQYSAPFAPLDIGLEHLQARAPPSSSEPHPIDWSIGPESPRLAESKSSQSRDQSRHADTERVRRLFAQLSARVRTAAQPKNPRRKKVARDGIEPPTRGFSIPCSTD